MVSVIDVRNRCRIVARRFGYSLRLFDRIPTYIFQYFRSEDPLATNSPSFSQIDIVIIFMIINNISANLTMAFYASGDQEMDTVFRLQDLFTTMLRLYETTNQEDLYEIFGTYFAYHLETRTLRRIDMVVVDFNRGSRQLNDFVPNNPHWERNRNMRNLIRNGLFRVEDDFDLHEVRIAIRTGLLPRGRSNRRRQL